MKSNSPVNGNVLASGDDEADAEAEREVIASYESGNPWAWCCVRVVARWRGCKGQDFLGCCSYDSQEDFESGGYFEDMKAEALADLRRTLELAS